MYSVAMDPLIIFDLDGTLADTRADLAQAVNLTRRHFGLKPLGRDEIISYVGNGSRILMERSFHDCPETDTDEAARIFSRQYARFPVQETRLYPGVRDGLEKMFEKNCVMAVLSNKPGDLSRQVVGMLGLARFFIRIIGGGDLARLKPDPSGIYEMIRSANQIGLDIDPERTWMVGDHHTDLDTARNAGVASVFCSYGFGRKEGRPFTFQADDFSDLLTIAGCAR